MVISMEMLVGEKIAVTFYFPKHRALIPVIEIVIEIFERKAQIRIEAIAHIVFAQDGC